MASKKFAVDIDLTQNALLNATFQVLSTAPTNPAPKLGQFYYNSTDKTPYVWTGSKWLDLGQIYTHPTLTVTNSADPALAGNKVISRIQVSAEGHVTNVETRDLTPADISAATAIHTHAFTDITGLPTQTFLGNNTAGTSAAKALTVAEVLVMLSIAYGSLAVLQTGTDTGQRTWSAKDINDYVNGKLSTYLTVVNLALGTRTSTTMPITNTAGTGVTLPVATTTLAGLMSAADKVKLDGVATGANNYVHPTNNPGAHPFATELTSGLAVLSQLVVNNEGHVTTIKSRNLTAADIAKVMIVAGTDTTSANATWSASTINAKLQAAINQAQTGALTYKGNYAPSTNTPNLGTDATIKVGYTYVVSDSGTFAGQAVEAGDMIIAKVDNPGTTAANWQVVNKNIPAIVAATETVQGIVELATSAETITGTDATRAVTPAGLKAAMQSYIGGYYATFGDGSSTAFTITHNLGTQLVLVQTRITATKEEIITDWKAASANTVTINTNSAPSTNQYEVLITKI